ncbi:MAG: spermidine synthase [Mycobacteriales bacterium]
MPRRQEPTGGSWPVRFGTAELARDLDRPRGWQLMVDGTPQSYVDLDDPEHLEFEYVRLLADVVDATGTPGAPLAVVHLGGGACTLPRYVAATRPGSTQVVVEADDLLVELVRAQLGTTGFRLRVGDGREALQHLAKGTSDLVVTDVFVGARVPGAFATVEFVREVRAVLKDTGGYAVNVADTGVLAFARAQAATLLEVFPHVVVLADPGVLRGRRFGNVVLAGSAVSFDLDELRRVTARSFGRARVEDGAAFRRTAAACWDANPPVAPLPPHALFS